MGIANQPLQTLDPMEMASIRVIIVYNKFVETDFFSLPCG